MKLIKKGKLPNSFEYKKCSWKGHFYIKCVHCGATFDVEYFELCRNYLDHHLFICSQCKMVTALDDHGLQESRRRWLFNQWLVKVKTFLVSEDIWKTIYLICGK